MVPPDTYKGVSKFIVPVNSYCEMWLKILHTLKTLTKLTSSRVKFK